MNELEEKLNAVLSDPAELSRLSQMASQLMGSMGGDARSENAAAPEAPDGLAAMAAKALQGMKGVAGKPPLLEGVAPYISSDRRKRLERALRLASAAHWALPALREMGGTDDGL